MADEQPIEVLSAERFSRDRLLQTLRRTPLRGREHVRPYAQATLELTAPLATDLLAPAQRYVLMPRVREMIALRAALLREGVDPFDLNGGLHVRVSSSPEETIPLTPPIVEESSEPDGRTALLINDGLHRVYAARTLGAPISVVLVKGVAPEYPYYAYALRSGWSEVVELEELPDDFQKKDYRQPDDYKALFRDFNAVLPGIQQQRKKSNPAHLRA